MLDDIWYGAASWIESKLLQARVEGQSCVSSFRLLIQLEHWGSLRLKLSRKIYGLQAQALRQDWYGTSTSHVMLAMIWAVNPIAKYQDLGLQWREKRDGHEPRFCPNNSYDLSQLTISNSTLSLSLSLRCKRNGERWHGRRTITKFYQFWSPAQYRWWRYNTNWWLCHCHTCCCTQHPGRTLWLILYWLCCKYHSIKL